jgi:hypothetical protein
MKKNLMPLILCLIFSLNISAQSAGIKGESVYKMRPIDAEALYFTPDNFKINNDGKTDVTDELQKAIDSVKTGKNYGIIFIPEGKYLISRTIFIPPAIRVIGYGKERPELILSKNSPGYQVAEEGSRYPEKYMIFFSGALVSEGRPAQDAGAGTFYSAIENINLRIEDGNPIAVGIRAHFAQHGFVSHVDIYAGKGKAGISEVGNELSKLRIYGGDYGIIAGQSSPSWPVALTDAYFEGQRKAAINCNNTGFAIIGMHVKNVPVAVEIRENDTDRLYMEKCLFDNISVAAVIISREQHALTQVNMQNIVCRKVPVVAQYRQSGKIIESDDRIYQIRDFTYGLTMEDMEDDSEYRTICDLDPLDVFPDELSASIPSLPQVEEWVNIRDLGARGDGITDDLGIFREAVARYRTIYVPQGWYRLTGTLKLNPGTRLIGLHPWATQLIIQNSEPAFSGFGGPVPVVESSEGGDDIINGIGISTAGINYRATGIKWMAGRNSYLNDIKFVGGHGTMRRPVTESQQGPGARTGAGGSRPSGSLVFGMGPRAASTPDNPVYEQGVDLAWDNQFWSLWITNNGGGTIKDIWTANSYAASGLYACNSSTPCSIIACSLEHHVRNEARFENINGWNLYAFQLEEESREGKECQSVELSGCSNMLFANFWNYRVIRVYTPKSYGIRVWNCKNIEFRNVKNYTQKLVNTEFVIYDVIKKLPVYPWEFARLKITGLEKGIEADKEILWEPVKLMTGFNFLTGITSNSKGDVYFCDSRLKRIYTWSARKKTGRLLTDFPLQPLVLATDSRDNLLAVFRYDPQPGYMIGGKQETVKRLADDNVAYSSWGNSGWAAYPASFNPENPEETFSPLPRVATKSLDSIEQAWYPSSRWHYTFESAAVYYPDSAFLAPDGVTIIPEVYDIGRCASLSAARPGQKVYASDEIRKRTISMSVDGLGRLHNPVEVFPRGETSYALDSEGNLYLAEGQIFVYDKNGMELRRINLEERPVSISTGGVDGETLFVATETSLYGIRIK